MLNSEDGVIEQAHLAVGHAEVVVSVLILFLLVGLNALFELFEDLVQTLLVRRGRRLLGRRHAELVPPARPQRSKKSSDPLDPTAFAGADGGREPLSSLPRSAKDSSGSAHPCRDLPAAERREPALFSAFRTLSVLFAAGDSCFPFRISLISLHEELDRRHVGPGNDPLCFPRSGSTMLSSPSTASARRENS